MYCIKCGVELADTERKCPLCNTVVCHPDFDNVSESPLYPSNKLPECKSDAKSLNGAIIILFLIPLSICLVADLLVDGTLEWFGYVVGALVVAYIAFALPLWFRKPTPVIFVPCNFVSVGLYLSYINYATNGKWFMSFVFPLVGGLCLITCTVVSLMYYLRRGGLYIIGGSLIALGLFMLLVEFLMGITFDMHFIGWSIYPLVVFALVGCLLIYFAINRKAREVLKRKLFF